MTSTRILAVVVGACALAISALILLPMDEAPGEPASVSAPAKDDFATRWSAAPTSEPADETHAALPRLWLGNPVGR